MALDANGNLAWRGYGQAFGKTQVDPASSLTMNLRFAGQYFDAETGTHYNWMRDYDPATGRYRQADPIGLNGGINLYSYVGGNPVNKVDPLGLASCTYSISSHTLTCTPNSGGDPVVLGPGGVWSGVGRCANNMSCVDIPDLGPIVPGNYNMNRDDRPGHEGFWRLEPDPKIPGWKCYAGKIFGVRCGFELHPGGTSLGCITADKKSPDAMDMYRTINDLLNRENGRNHLVVVP